MNQITSNPLFPFVVFAIIVFAWLLLKPLFERVRADRSNRAADEQGRLFAEIRKIAVEIMEPIRLSMSASERYMETTAGSLEAIRSLIEDSGDTAQLRVAIESLSGSVSSTHTNIERIATSSSLMARGASKMNDNITALRVIVYGGGRAEDMPSTVNDPEGVEKANMEADVHNLMQDMGLSRSEAERRVSDLYSSRVRR